jgi:hypothetical protein
MYIKARQTKANFNVSVSNEEILLNQKKNTQLKKTKQKNNMSTAYHNSVAELISNSSVNTK